MAQQSIGIAIHKPTAASMLQAVVQAEQAGVSKVWLTTGAGPDGLTVFAASAVKTQKVAMGTAIVPTYPRHPLAVAQQTADIAQFAPGRFTLGLGPSHAAVMEGRYGIPYKRPLGHLREFVAVVTSLLRGQQTDFEGEHFKVHAKLTQGAQVPVIISALRPTSFALAGEICDGAVSWLCPAPYLRDMAMPALEKGAQEAGRARGKLIGHAFLALTTDAAELQQGVSEFLPHYPRLTNYQEMFAAAGYPEARQSTWSQAMVDAVVLHGDEEQCRRKLDSFLRVSGSDEIILSIMFTGSDRNASLQRAMQWVAALG